MLDGLLDGLRLLSTLAALITPAHTWRIYNLQFLHFFHTFFHIQTYICIYVNIFRVNIKITNVSIVLVYCNKALFQRLLRNIQIYDVFIEVFRYCVNSILFNFFFVIYKNFNEIIIKQHIHVSPLELGIQCKIAIYFRLVNTKVSTKQKSRLR